MCEAGMMIGSHTLNHLVLSKLSSQEQEKEIVAYFNFIKSVVGELDLRTFCYPYGGFHTFNHETECILEQNNCDFAFNVEARDIDCHDLSDRKQALPRSDCNMFPFGACYNIAAGNIG